MRIDPATITYLRGMISISDGDNGERRSSCETPDANGTTGHMGTHRQHT